MRTKVDGYKILAWVIGVVVILALALPALGNHPPASDIGTDVPNTGAEMNQASFWESYFDGDGYSVSCAKYEGHNGFIPAEYDAAVVKSGSEMVHVYADLTNVASFTAIGPPNPNNQHPNRRHTAPFSWVMKCKRTPDPTTTTTIAEPTTTTIEATTTTMVEMTTTTAPTTTTTQEESASTTTVASPSTTMTSTPTTTETTDPPASPTTTPTAPTTPPEGPVPLPTIVSDPPATLPYTGMSGTTGLILVGAALLGGGIEILRRARSGC